jgi:GNAT superfamily N-acetyltransferase
VTEDLTGKPPKRQKSMKKEERIRTLRRDEATAHFNTLNLCYEPWGTEQEWKRRYVLHPDFDITKNVLVVEENGKWVGGGTAWFRQAILKNDKTVTVYGAGDLYVRPDYRGKGIYSTAMRGLNQLAQEKGAALGFAYPSIYRLPAMALPKYGFVETFYPSTHVLVLRPEGFFRFLVARAKKTFLPEKFNGIKLKLIVIFHTSNGKREITGTFKVVKGQIVELREAQDKENVDLMIKTESDILLNTVSGFFLGNKRLLTVLVSAFLRGRLRLRFSVKLIRVYLGL